MRIIYRHRRVTANDRKEHLRLMPFSTVFQMGRNWTVSATLKDSQGEKSLPPIGFYEDEKKANELASHLNESEQMRQDYIKREGEKEDARTQRGD